MNTIVHHAEALLVALRHVDDERIAETVTGAREALFALLDAIAETGALDDVFGEEETVAA